MLAIVNPMQETQSLENTYQILRSMDKSAQVRSIVWLLNRLDIEEEVRHRLPSNPNTEVNSEMSAETTTETVAGTVNEYQATLALKPDILTRLSQSGQVLAMAFKLKQAGIVVFQSRQLTSELHAMGIQLSNIAKVLNDLSRRNPAPITITRKNKSGHKQFELTMYGELEIKRLLHLTS